jgi:hypothetical protein
MVVTTPPIPAINVRRLIQSPLLEIAPGDLIIGGSRLPEGSMADVGYGVIFNRAGRSCLPFDAGVDPESTVAISS